MWDSLSTSQLTNQSTKVHPKSLESKNVKQKSKSRQESKSILIAAKFTAVLLCSSPIFFIFFPTNPTVIEINSSVQLKSACR